MKVINEKGEIFFVETHFNHMEDSLAIVVDKKEKKTLTLRTLAELMKDFQERSYKVYADSRDSVVQ